MLRRIPASVSSLALAVAFSLAPARSLAAWEPNIAYGGSMPADIYVPDTPADNAPLVVSLHYCGGNKNNAQPWLTSFASTHGFYIVTPQAGGQCFDAAPARSGEREQIVNMVEWAVTEHGVDPDRVYSTGASSGACMVHALLAAYPDVFAGGSALAGVPAGAWTGGNAYGWSTPNQSAQQWGDVVRNENPGYAGPWPRVQIWQGQGDTTLNYSQNFQPQVDQWTNVWGLGPEDGVEETVQPEGAQNSWTRTSFTDPSGVLAVEANSGGPQVPHDVSGLGVWGDVVRFFGIDQPKQVTPEPGSGGASGSGGEGAGGQASGVGGTAPMDSGGSGNGGAGGTPTVGGSGGSGTGGASASAGGSVADGTGATASGAATGAGVGGAASDDPGPNASDAEGGCSLGTQSGHPAGTPWILGLLVAVSLVARRRARGSAA